MSVLCTVIFFFFLYLPHLNSTKWAYSLIDTYLWLFPYLKCATTYAQGHKYSKEGIWINPYFLSHFHTTRWFNISFAKDNYFHHYTLTFFKKISYLCNTLKSVLNNLIYWLYIQRAEMNKIASEQPKQMFPTPKFQFSSLKQNRAMQKCCYRQVCCDNDCSPDPISSFSWEHNFFA